MEKGKKRGKCRGDWEEEGRRMENIGRKQEVEE